MRLHCQVPTCKAAPRFLVHSPKAQKSQEDMESTDTGHHAKVAAHRPAPADRPSHPQRKATSYASSWFGSARDTSLHSSVSLSRTHFAVAAFVEPGIYLIPVSRSAKVGQLRRSEVERGR